MGDRYDAVRGHGLPPEELATHNPRLNTGTLFPPRLYLVRVVLVILMMVVLMLMIMAYSGETAVDVAVVLFKLLLSWLNVLWLNHKSLLCRSLGIWMSRQGGCW